MATLPDHQPQPSRETTIRNISLAALIICPALIALPPRKLDIYTVGLVTGTLFATNHLTEHYTGRSIATRTQDRMARLTSSASSLPPQALETQRRLREERMMERVRDVPVGEREGVLEALRREQELEERRNSRGVLKRIWLGGEDEDWKVKRDRREKEALESGEGYGGLIMAQIKEVFGGVKGKVEEIEEVDREVVEREKREGKR